MRIAARSGFTLAELIVSMALLSFVMGAVFTTVLKAQRESTRQQDVVQAQNAVRDAEQILTTILRTAGADPANSKLTLLDPDPLGHAVLDNIRTVADFNPADKDVLDPMEDVQVHVDSDTLFVRWQANAAPQAVAYPIQSLRFAYYSTNGTLLTTPASIATATRVKVSIVAPHSPYNDRLERRETWVYLRNRR
jgi:prepilin-type N-terminal cleavage/methylation domain-containing protein